MTCFFQIISKRNMFLKRGYVLKITGCLQNDCHPPTSGTVPYPNERGHEGHCQQLELNVRKATVVFWHN